MVGVGDDVGTTVGGIVGVGVARVTDVLLPPEEFATPVKYRAKTVATATTMTTITDITILITREFR